ncbi:hypothetical protein ABTL43_19355, partial [Acinetobacter baumannii]
DVTIPETGQSRNLVIVDEGDLDKGGRDATRDLATRRAALAKLKFHPREEAGNAALMARAERTYEDFVGEDRRVIGQWITEFAGALASQDH